jgi:hypothetical protein
MKPHLHVTARVGMDLLTRRARDEGGLDTGDARAGREARQAEGHLSWDGLDLERASPPFLPGAARGNHDVIALGARAASVAWVELHPEREAWGEGFESGPKRDDTGIDPQRLEEHRSEPLALGGVAVAERRLVHLDLLLLRHPAEGHGLEVEGGIVGRVVAERDLARAAHASGTRLEQAGPVG